MLLTQGNSYRLTPFLFPLVLRVTGWKKLAELIFEHSFSPKGGGGGGKENGPFKESLT